jgi:hypothetical protein
MSGGYFMTSHALDATTRSISDLRMIAVFANGI